MNCPQCEHQIESADAICQHCGFDLSSAAWVVLTKVYPPDDLIIESLLNSYGIPHKILRREVPQMPVTVGPLAEVIVIVPEQILAQAKALLQELEDQSE
ncbi:MAG TPA: hypothetical protein PLG09_02320 [Syntrophomonadaceae bacterium]|nr:hypothetical protein [Syntrophomonadaceae bacterium]HPU47753.1 hypothetical protein [Syntrophomonadaceae bacterium]